MTDDGQIGTANYGVIQPGEHLSPGSPALIDPWDANVDYRADELSNDRDSAYSVLSTLVLSLLADRIAPGGAVLDAGCGLGYLSGSMIAAGYQVEGLDPSRQSIEYAKKIFAQIRFQSCTVESFAADARRLGQYDAVVANMVMHTTPNLQAFIECASSMLRPGGVFIATIPHPWFFLQGRGFPVNKYSGGNGFLIPFRIHGGRTHPESVPYFQRTLQDYCEAIRKTGLTDLWIKEEQRAGDDRIDMLALTASRER